MVAAVAERAGLSIAAVGSPAVGRAQELAARFEARPLDDLRAALSAAQPGLFLIASPGPLGRPGQPLDAEVLLAARERGVHVASLDPLPASLLDLAHALPPGTTLDPDDPLAGPGTNLAWASFGPLSRAAKPFADLPELLAAFGPVRAAVIQSLAAPIEGSLGTRLLDTFDLVLSLLGEPESIDAAYCNPLLTRNLHATPGETLHDLRGDMTANLRLPGGRACSLLLSDQGARFERAMTFIGPAGRLTVTDDGAIWLDPSGKPTEEAHAKKPKRAAKPRADAAASRFIDLLADHLTALRTGGHASMTPLHWPRLLAMAQAALLSARTGEGESPATMLRMAGA